MPTIRDVAKALNISIATVSRALDGYEDVSAETRQRVIDTAREMGYSPNRAARQLRRQKAETIGFILPASAQRFDEPFFTEFISGLGDALADAKFDLLVANAKTDQQEQDLFQRWINSRKVDGFVLNRVQMLDWRVRFLARHKLPFSALGKSHDGLDYPHINIKGRPGYLELIQHLREVGFTRLAFIGGNAGLISSIDRFKWFKSALAHCGLAFDPDYYILSDMTSGGGYTAARHLLDLQSPPDAILAVNDETAFGVLHAAHERGLAIGRELAIAGFDGVQDSRHTEPPLTTLDIPVPDIARQLVRMLLAVINNESLAEGSLDIQPKLLIRASSGG